MDKATLFSGEAREKEGESYKSLRETPFANSQAIRNSTEAFRGESINVITNTSFLRAVLAQSINTLAHSVN